MQAKSKQSRASEKGHNKCLNVNQMVIAKIIAHTSWIAIGFVNKWSEKKHSFCGAVLRERDLPQFSKSIV